MDPNISILTFLISLQICNHDNQWKKKGFAFSCQSLLCRYSLHNLQPGLLGFLGRGERKKSLHVLPHPSFACLQISQDWLVSSVMHTHIANSLWSPSIYPAPSICILSLLPLPLPLPTTFFFSLLGPWGTDVKKKMQKEKEKPKHNLILTRSSFCQKVFLPFLAINHKNFTSMNFGKKKSSKWFAKWYQEQSILNAFTF